MILSFLENILMFLLGRGEAAQEIFLHVLNMSITASYVILLVLLCRLLLKKAPKIYSYVLWFTVLFLLLCPVALPSPVSFFNLLSLKGNQTVMEYIPMDIGLKANPAVNSGIPVLSRAISRILPAPDPAALTSANPLQILIPVAAAFWILGMCGFVIYVLISAKRLRRITASAVQKEDGVYECTGLASPFARGLFAGGIFGTSFLQARIYLPVSLPEKERSVILAHERIHLRRLDPLVKWLFFIALAIHWGNPLVWLAFFLMIRDMEMSCDEAVLQKECKKDDTAGFYSATLLHMASVEAGFEKVSSFGPLAFGESSVAARIKNILRFHNVSYRSRLLLSVLCCAFLFTCACNPVSGGTSLTTRIHYYIGQLTKGTQTAADILWEHRTPYVGDNSAVGNLLGALTVPADLGIVSEGMELQTSQIPYSLTIRYRAESDTAQSQLDQDDNWIYENAAILFALIDNVDVIYTRVTFSDGFVYFYPANRARIANDLYHDPFYSLSPTSREDLEQYLRLAHYTTYTLTNAIWCQDEVSPVSSMNASVVSADSDGTTALVSCLDDAPNASQGGQTEYFLGMGDCLIYDENGNRITSGAIREGDQLNITFDSMIMETYPMQIHGTIYIRKGVKYNDR